MTAYDTWKTTDPNEDALTGSEAIDVLVPDFDAMTWPQRLTALIESLRVERQKGAWEAAWEEICERYDDDLIAAAEDARRSGGEDAECDA